MQFYLPPLDETSKLPKHSPTHLFILFYLMFLHKIKPPSPTFCYSYKHPPGICRLITPSLSVTSQKSHYISILFFSCHCTMNDIFYPTCPRLTPFSMLWVLSSNSIWGICPLLSTFFFLWKFPDMFKTFILKEVLSGSLCLLSCQCLPCFFLFGICQFTYLVFSLA